MVSMELERNIINSNGVCHGGMLFTLADILFSYAYNSRNLNSVALHCSINFLKPVSLGDHLTASAQEIQLHGENRIYNIEIKKQEKTTIALFCGYSRTIQEQIIKIGNAHE